MHADRGSETGGKAACTLTLVRHGQSEWNLANRFTGWADVDLTERGIAEARLAGRLLSEDGQQHDMVCTSTLRRAIRTACLTLSVTDQCWLPIVKDARLNEQHSGQLMGKNKAELAEVHGVEQVMRWRRTFDCAPPPIAEVDPLQYAILEDERYRDVCAERVVRVPPTESLRDTCARVASFWDETLAPALRAGKRVLLVSHGNTLRALVKLLDGVSDGETYHLDLPTACPVVYELDAELRPLGAHGTWGTSSTVRHGRYLMPEASVLQAQAAMRSQCTRDIAITTVSRTGASAVTTCDARTAEAASSSKVTLDDGHSYNVRCTPPSYFALESARIQQQARDELLGFRLGAAASAAPGAAAPRQPPSCLLLLMRHGFSDYNAQNRFTGWLDVDLSNRGREEARVAGSMLREAGVRRIERVYSSYLKRAIKSAWLMLDEMEMQWVPISYSWRLNERHYGALQGRNKRECSDEFSVRQVQQWRRGVNDRPPACDGSGDCAVSDRRYDGVRVPEAESLADCAERVRPFVEDELRPAMLAAVERAAAAGGGTVRSDQTPVFVIASSENLIRALIADMERLDPSKVPLLDIPYATPLVFELDAQLEPLPNDALAAAPLRHGWYLGDAERIKEVQANIREQVVRARPQRTAGEAAEPYDGDSCYAPAGEDGQLEWVCGDERPGDDADADAAAAAAAAAGRSLEDDDSPRRRRAGRGEYAD